MKIKAWICIALCIVILSLSVGCAPSEATTKEFPLGMVKAEDSADGFATVYVPDNRAAKVLLLADPQLDPTEKYSIVGSRNELTIKFLDKFLDAAQADLVIIAGDVVMSALVNNWSWFCQIADIFETKRIPWTFTFGNHDCENKYTSNKATTESYSWQMTKPAFIEAVQAEYQYCLIYSDDCEDGYGNHVVNVRNTKGKLLNTFCNLDCVYDNDEGYSHVITQAQTEYYESVIGKLSAAEGKTIPSIVVTHVALPEMFIGFKEAKEGGDQSVYYYGELLEGNYSKYVDQTRFFDVLLSLGSTKAVFFGHHHGNDASISYKGIRLSFIPHSGMSHEYRTDHSKDYQLTGWASDTVFDFTDIDVYGDDRGGVLVAIEQTATYSFTSLHAADVIADYSEWAIDYDRVAASIAETRGEEYVVRGK